ncbi:pyridoxal phosphate-dependent aminotransferase [Pseudactinotalea sp.]|uniref:pyridoxal phosphate-dependent aminotransferase n=1 Tax=Pseudactinotalea sp. TaxID=1926260 RepID=UPI003B3B5F39
MDLAWSSGPDIIGLHVGEPSFPTPAHVVRGAIDALKAGHTRYVPNAGIPALREAIAAKVASENGITADAADVVVTAGGMQALSVAMLAILRPGDEVLLPDPGWPNFAMAVQLLHGRPRGYRLLAENGFVPDIDELESLVTTRTRAIILNTPSNPLGTVLDASVIQDVLAFARRHGLWVISDECYDAITFDAPHISPASLDPDAQVVSCFSFSKTYSMTGMRVGYVVTPPGLGSVLAKMQEATLSCINASAQFGALAALEGGRESVDHARSVYRDRRDEACRTLERLGVTHLRPEGSFFLWVDVRDRTDSVHDYALRAVVDQRVAVAPGTAFGASGEGYVRLSLATETAQLIEGIERLFG